MRRFCVLFLPACAIFLLAADQPKIPPMPQAVSNNAVASLKGGLELYSVMGIGEKKTWDDITRNVYILYLPKGKWSVGPPVPGVAGRLGSAAIGAKGQIFVFGGFTVDGRGEESILPDVNSFVASEKRWFRAEDIPVPVDSAVIGMAQNRYIYLIGGRAKNGPVNNVQVYDIEQNLWRQATPSPGAAVFGHAGGLADDTIVYVDGAKKNTVAGEPYVNSDECWMGKIDKKDPYQIVWSKVPPHPGSAHFGIVAGEGGAHRIIFSGGTAKPHKFNGVGYDGKPAEVSPVTFDYDLRNNKWETISEDTNDARADTRGMVSTQVGPMMIGGMLSNGAFSARVLVLIKK